MSWLEIRKVVADRSDRRAELLRVATAIYAASLADRYDSDGCWVDCRSFLGREDAVIEASLLIDAVDKAMEAEEA
jgi:hypothetical protein